MADEELTLSQKVAGWPARLKAYVDDLRTEMSRVTWPPWKQVRATTVVVILSVFAFSAYFMVVDAVCNAGVQKIVTIFSK